MSKIRLMITCPKCNKQIQGKRVMLGYVSSCSCGYIFTEEDKQKALEEVRALRKLEKRREQEREDTTIKTVTVSASLNNKLSGFIRCIYHWITTTGVEASARPQ